MGIHTIFDAQRYESTLELNWLRDLDLIFRETRRNEQTGDGRSSLCALALSFLRRHDSAKALKDSGMDDKKKKYDVRNVYWAHNL